MRFKNPANNYIEESSSPWLWCLLFGGFYFGFKGIWRHLFLSFFLGLVTVSMSWFIYPFFASEIVRNSYLRNGWIEVGAQPQIEYSEDKREVTKVDKAVKYAVYTFLALFVLSIVAFFAMGIISTVRHGGF